MCLPASQAGSLTNRSAIVHTTKGRYRHLSQAQSSLDDQNAVPLCVDLDGTLVHTDVLIEAVFALLKRNVLYAVVLPFWVLKGKAYFKQQVAHRVKIDPSLLPYHEEFLAYLKAERSNGRRLVLATSSNIKFAERIARHLGIFDSVLASDAENSLSGERKVEGIRKALGNSGFDYAGNSNVDLSVWPHAREAILVNPDRGVLTAAQKVAKVGSIFDDRASVVKSLLEAMRIHQWLKNALVFVPLFTAHQVGDLGLLSQAALAFLSFSLCASSVYLLNDLFDLESDRQHPTKRNRPFAKGSVSIHYGVALIPVLLLVAFAIALLLPIEFIAVLAIYYVATLSYSLWLRRVVMLDVLVLAGLYTIRLIAGGAAVSITLSFWLLAFSMFLFLSLALVKRYSELKVLSENTESEAWARGYRAGDLDALMSFGTASGYIAALVLALYINGDQVTELYSYPQAIWPLCPLLLYWISRVWILARRGELHEDPVLFAIRDRRSHLVAVIGLIMLWVAT